MGQSDYTIEPPAPAQSAYTIEPPPDAATPKGQPSPQEDAQRLLGARGVQISPAGLRPTFRPPPMQQSLLAPAGGSFNPFASVRPAQGSVAVPGSSGYPGVAPITGFLNDPAVQLASGYFAGGELGGGVQRQAAKLAPKIAESSLGVTEQLRSRSRQIGEAVLENTHGITVAKLRPEIKQAIQTITTSMENGVNRMTQSGVTGDVSGARQVLQNAISKVPRNAPSLSQKLQGLTDLLHLGNPAQTRFTPDELLEMKRGINKEIKTWPPEWQKISDVKSVEQQLYGAIDKELDRLIPGNKEKNDLINNLIAAQTRVKRMSAAAPMTQKLAQRMLTHTGALTSAAATGALGYERGGIPGAIIGGTLGLALPEMAAASPTQMAIARVLNAIGHSNLTPEVIRALTMLGTRELGKELEGK